MINRTTYYVDKKKKKRVLIVRDPRSNVLFEDFENVRITDNLKDADFVIIINYPDEERKKEIIDYCRQHDTNFVNLERSGAYTYEELTVLANRNKLDVYTKPLEKDKQKEDKGYERERLP